MGGNAFYSNAEAYAFEILQQKLMKEAQRSAQQMMMELSALKTLFNQGQFIYCIPFGGVGLSGHSVPLPLCPPFSPPCPPEPAFCHPNHQHHVLAHPTPLPPAPPQPPLCPQPAPLGPPTTSTPHALSTTSHNQQSVVHVNVKSALPKTSIVKSGSDECKLGDTGIEVSIDLRDYLPAEITLDVEEKSVEVKACHVSAQGSKTFARRYDLPACIALDSVKCILSHDGFLLFFAAWVKME